MTVNTGDYDLRDLRRLADPHRESPTEDEDETDDLIDGVLENVEDLYRLGQREELVSLQTAEAASGTLPAKPYLDSLPSTYGVEIVVFEWLDFLINKAGFENTGNALKYYERVDWITEDARQDLRSYMRGFSEVESFDPDQPGPADLDIDDHLLSLVYIARLASSPQ